MDIRLMNSRTTSNMTVSEFLDMHDAKKLPLHDIRQTNNSAKIRVSVKEGHAPRLELNAKGDLNKAFVTYCSRHGIDLTPHLSNAAKDHGGHTNLRTLIDKLSIKQLTRMFSFITSSACIVTGKQDLLS